MTLGEYTILPYMQGVTTRTVSLGVSARVTRPQSADLLLHPAHASRTTELRGTQVMASSSFQLLTYSTLASPPGPLVMPFRDDRPREGNLLSATDNSDDPASESMRSLVNRLFSIGLTLESALSFRRG